MSYHGTVHCSYCGQRGHNRLGCPKRKAHARQNPESYEARKLAREQEKRKQQVANRKCSYCHDPGHNRRGCSILKEDKKLILQRQKEYIQNFTETTASSGLSPGSLVYVPDERRNRHNKPEKYFIAMVTGYHWQNVDFLLKDVKNNSWRSRDKGLIATRVVSSYGYEEEDSSYYYSPPKFNDVKHLTSFQLSKALGAVLAPISEDSGGWTKNSAEEVAIRIVSPKNTQILFPEEQEYITSDLKSVFNLDPGPRADEYSKVRNYLHNECWQHVRPDEYKEAARAFQENHGY